MRLGNLVRLKRACIGIPKGSIGLLTEKLRETATPHPDFPKIEIWVVKFTCRNADTRLLGRDLEVVSS